MVFFTCTWQFPNLILALVPRPEVNTHSANGHYYETYYDHLVDLDPINDWFCLFKYGIHLDLDLAVDKSIEYVFEFEANSLFTDS